MTDPYNWIVVIAVVVGAAAMIFGWLSLHERNKRWNEHLGWRDERIEEIEQALESTDNKGQDLDDLYAAIEILYGSDPIGPYVTRWIEGLP